MTVSVCIATFGSDDWRDLALSRAYPSALGQDAHEVVLEHQPEGTLASARNAVADQARGDWLLFLDADDELGPHYIDSMAWAAEAQDDPALLTPRVSYIIKGKQQAPKFWPEMPLEMGNWCVIGTLVPRALFAEVGGFGEWPIYEDWALFASCHSAGAQVVKVPEAVYLAHWRGDSRNKSLSRQEATQVHYEIGRELFPEHYGPEWLAQHMRSIQPKLRHARNRRAVV